MRQSARRSQLTGCDAAPSGGEGKRQKGKSVSGDVTRNGDEKTQEAKRAAQPAHQLRRGAERGRREAAKGGGVSGDAVRGVNEESQEARRVAGPAHHLQ